MNNLIRVENDKPILEAGMVSKIIQVESEMKALKEVYDGYKSAIKKAMEEKGIIKIIDDINGLSITLIPEQRNLEKFHKDKFQEEHPNLYDEYVTMDGKKSAYITVRTK